MQLVFDVEQLLPLHVLNNHVYEELIELCFVLFFESQNLRLITLLSDI